MPRLGVPLLPSAVRWGLVVAVAAVIFANSIFIAAPAPADPGPFWDKQLHFAGYAALSASLAYATARRDINARTRVLAVLLIAVAYGIAIELLQAPLPDRSFSYADMLANGLGALLGLAFFAIEARVPYVPLDRRS